MYGVGCRVQGVGCGVWGVGYRVQGAGYRVQDVGCRGTVSIQALSVLRGSSTYPAHIEARSVP